MRRLCHHELVSVGREHLPQVGNLPVAFAEFDRHYLTRSAGLLLRDFDLFPEKSCGNLLFDPLLRPGNFDLSFLDLRLAAVELGLLDGELLLEALPGSSDER